MDAPINSTGGTGPAEKPQKPAEKPPKMSKELQERAQTFFKDMPMTPKEFQKFMLSLTQFLSVQIKSEHEEMMKQLRRLGRGGDEE